MLGRAHLVAAYSVLLLSTSLSKQVDRLPKWCSNKEAAELAKVNNGYHTATSPTFGFEVMATVARKLADARCPAAGNAGRFPFDYYSASDNARFTTNASSNLSPILSGITGSSNSSANASLSTSSGTVVPLSADLSRQRSFEAYPELYQWNTTTSPRVLWNLECMNGLGNILDGYTQVKCLTQVREGAPTTMSTRSTGSGRLSWPSPSQLPSQPETPIVTPSTRPPL